MQSPTLRLALGTLILGMLGLTGVAKDLPATGPATKPLTPEEKAAALEKDVTQGALRVVGADGQVVECPLKHTDVKADVAGFIARVKVTQTFTNPTKEKIEAVYVFPLPHEAAIDDMTMVIGQRKIVGIIKRRAEARQIYEAALARGATAALLEQERPNIFTQSVGNIEPGQDINIEISYVDVLKYDLGVYEFHFPIVVGPRYNPGSPQSTPPTPADLQGKVGPMAPNTDRVPDASRINPPVLKPGFRTGHDISLAVNLNAGVPIQKLEVLNHQHDVARPDDRKATVKIAPHDQIPNKDFVLRYSVMGKEPEMALLAHTGKYGGDWRGLGEGYFMLMIQPKDDPKLKNSPPREIVFLVDVSGSMGGGPIAKCIESMQHMLKMCREGKDTFQVITFAGAASKVFEKPVSATKENIAAAAAYCSAMKSGGGTEMLKGVKMAIDDKIDRDRVRIIIMLTDGYIGNEKEIIEHVGKNCNDQVRFWAVGIGSAPNMFLIDGVAKQGGGMGKKLALNEDAQPLCQEIMTRIQRAQLAKIKIDWGGLKVAETYPTRIPELWAGRPVIVYGRYAGGGDAKITVSGSVEGEPVSWPLAVSLPANEAKQDVLAKVWARQKIEDLMQQTYYGGSPEVEEVVTGIALSYSLMSQYTSFVAVDEKDAKQTETFAKPPRRMLVPVPIPEGTRFEGFFGGGGGGGWGVDEADGRMLKDAKRELARPMLQLGVAKKPGLAANTPMPALRYAGDKAKFQHGQFERGRSNAESLRKSYGPPASPRAGRGYALPAEPAITAGTLSVTNGAVIGKELEKLDRFAEDATYTANFLSTQAQPLVKAAQDALKSADELARKDDRLAARSAYLKAYFLDTAAANVGASAGQVAAQALAAIEKLHHEQVKISTKDLPALGAKLDLVLRDMSLAEALAAVSKAGGVEIKLIDGSLDDAAAVDRSAVRITWLDLRGATVAQALDWILQPARLHWWAGRGMVLAGAERRNGGVTSAWVYDVSAIALPSVEDMKKLNNDYQKMVDAAKKSAEEFMTPVRKAVKGDETTAAWFAPGQLLVIGDADMHKRAADTIAILSSGNNRESLDKDLAALQAVTSKRAADRKDAIAKNEAAMERMRIAAVHEQFSWQLLAAAADGKLDDEALTELQIAWKSPRTAELLDGGGAGLAMRSLWALRESRDALYTSETRPSQLTVLMGEAQQASRKSLEKAMEALSKNPEDSNAFMTVLYGSLASRHDAELQKKALAALSVEKPNSPLASARLVAKSLLGDARAIDAKALKDLIEKGVAGDDMVVLTAMAARRAGDDTWQAFRARTKELLGEQPLSGDVIVLVNRLSGAPLNIVAAK